MGLSLSIACASMGNHEAAVTSWQDTMSKPLDIVIDATTEGDDAGFLVKCDKAWRQTNADVIGYLHSDLFIMERGWNERVTEEFSDPRVAVVGFVGATQLGADDLYKIPFDLHQLARADVFSNLTDWEVHGKHETESRTVAVIDSCAVFARRDFLARLGGWPVSTYPNSSHCSDLWLCCQCARLGYMVRIVGVRATHRSGGRGDVGEHWLNQRGGDHTMHRRAHELIYHDFRDVLPVRIA
jgi:hypothetical protein